MFDCATENLATLAEPPTIQAFYLQKKIEGLCPDIRFLGDT